MGNEPEVLIRDVFARDGFQSWPDFVPTERKLAVIADVVEAGVRELETTSFVSPQAVPQLQDAAEVMARAQRGACRHMALVPNPKGAQRAADAGAEGIIAVISVSEAHNQANIRRSVAESVEGLDGIFAAVAEKKLPVYGALATSFGCPYQGDVPEDDVFRLVEAFQARGAVAVILADTTGMATPLQVKHLVSGFISRFSEIPVGLHFHNNRGTAMANVVASLDAGARIFDTALGGIGGCPFVPHAAGNLPTEDVVYMLEEMGVPTGIDLMALIAAACRLEQFLGQALPGQVMKSGPRDPKLAARVCAAGH